MNSVKQISGFTLIELIVVISIISILLLFSFPLFNDIQLFTETKGQAGDIARLADDLKKRAVKQNVDYLLHIDKSSAMIWITHENMDDKTKQEAKEKGTSISNSTQIANVQFAGIEREDLTEYRIRFRKEGYSDFVSIHITEDENNLTLKIEPFLSKTTVLHGHIDFENCI